MTSPSQLTYIGVLVVVFANQLCLPVPAVAFLIAAGALGAQGQMNASLIALLSVLPCLAADSLWFWFGRRWGSQATLLLCRLTPDPRRSAENAHQRFRRFGLPVLFVSKFLPGFDGLLPPLAGAEGVPFASFLALDGAGSLLWSACYVGLGYVFSSQVALAIEWVKHFGTALAFAMGVPCALYAGWRGLTLILMIRRLGVRRISPPMLDRKLRSGSKVALLDLLDFEQEATLESPQAIPGAFRIDPSRLRHSPEILVPGDVEIVLYCSSRSNIVSAQAALALQRIGIENVWVLEGGLHAWRETGLPLSQIPEAPEAVAERLGVRLPKA